MFAGTTEGRLLAEYLLEQQWPAVVCVATEYGRDVLDDTFRDRYSGYDGECLDIRQGRLGAAAITALLDEVRPGVVIDATHPYAVEVTENIRKACTDRQELCLLRCQREEDGGVGYVEQRVIHVPDAETAVARLLSTEGNILVTTGSKELGEYCRIEDFRQRIYARVLPSVEAVGLCRRLGYEGRHIIAMQGPFSEEMNLVQLKEYDCRYLVTKDGGSAGGFNEKLRAAERAGAVSIVIDRPGSGEGISLVTVKQQVKEWIDHEKR